MGNKQENNDVEDAGRCCAETLIQMAEALRDAIPRDKARVNAFRVLDYLARRTIELVREDKEPLIPTKDIYLDLDGNPNLEPSAWLSPLWSVIENKWYEQIEESVITRCRALGLAQYPRPVKLGGSPTLYRLDACPIEASQAEAPAPRTRVGERSAGLGVTYEPDLTLKLSRLGRLVFGGGLAWTRSKKFALAGVILGATLALVVMTYLGHSALLRSRSALSAADLLAFVVIIGGPWAFIRKVDKMMRIFDDRIVIAPDWTLAWKEFGATMELEGDSENGGTRAVKVVRYAAPCPICDGLLRLDRGEPDYPRRLVGRCSQSPREHVYSFDRITRRGVALVVPF